MITFTGSFVAFGKLSGRISGNPVSCPGMRLLTMVLILGAVGAIVWMVMGAGDFAAAGFEAAPVIESALIIGGAAFLLGILLVIPIGGADMPVVVALLNSYSGIAAAATGFVLDNTALIVSGALVGASGLILTNIMCEAMNRSLLNVLLGGFGGDSGGGDGPAGATTDKTASAHSVRSVMDMVPYATRRPTPLASFIVVVAAKSAERSTLVVQSVEVAATSADRSAFAVCVAKTGGVTAVTATAGVEIG